MIVRHFRAPSCQQSFSANQVRHASLLRRPQRPYTFTQLVTLSDGSTYLQRTTSPAPIHRSTKDVRNSAMWNPSSQKLLNVEEDEAGRLARFRERFGRGWDAEATDEDLEAEQGEQKLEKSKGQSRDSLLDLISGYGNTAPGQGAAKAEKAGKAGKKK